jgi:hypothetical protein
MTWLAGRPRLRSPLLDTPAGAQRRLGRALEQQLRWTPSTWPVATSKLRFAGAYPDSVLVEKGWGPDRTVARQVQALQAVTDQGVPIYVRPHPGAAGEVTAMGQAMDRLRQLLGPGIVVVADSALGRLGNLCAADRAGRNHRPPPARARSRA